MPRFSLSPTFFSLWQWSSNPSHQLPVSHPSSRSQQPHYLSPCHQMSIGSLTHSYLYSTVYKIKSMAYRASLLTSPAACLSNPFIYLFTTWSHLHSTDLKPYFVSSLQAYAQLLCQEGPPHLLPLGVSIPLPGLNLSFTLTVKSYHLVSSRRS